jgi:hypothetical protein
MSKKQTSKSQTTTDDLDQYSRSRETREPGFGAKAVDAEHRTPRETNQKSMEVLLLEQMRLLRERANINLDEVPANVRAAFGVSRSEAREKLEVLKREYAKFIDDNAVAMFLRGPRRHCNAFAEMARELGPVAVVDVESVYRQLASLILPKMRGRNATMNFDTPEYVTLVEGVVGLAKEYGASDISRPSFRPMSFSGDVQVVDFVRGFVNEAMGADFTNLLTRHEILVQALEVGFHTSVPCVVFNAGHEEEALAQNLVRDRRRVMVKNITSDEDVSEQTVMAALGELAALASGI